MNLLKLIIRGLLIVALVAVFNTYSSAGLGEFDTSNNQVELSSFISGGPSKDGIPALTDPKFLSADETDYLSDDDLIVGIFIDGKARAYPIQILNWHEIVNDSINNIPFAVTWCPLTKSAVTFDRRVEGHILEFGVSGLLYNSNVVLYDRKFDGLWSQMKMGGLTGKYAQNNLTLLHSELTSWKKWKQKHPGTQVLSKSTGHWRKYNSDPYVSYHKGPGVMFPLSRYDKRLPLKSLVLGVKVKGKAKAYPLKQLNEPIKDRIGGMDIKVIPQNESAVIKDKNGNPIPSVVAYWFAWSTFNKDTLIYSN